MGTILSILGLVRQVNQCPDNLGCSIVFNLSIKIPIQAQSHRNDLLKIDPPGRVKSLDIKKSVQILNTRGQKSDKKNLKMAQAKQLTFLL